MGAFNGQSTADEVIAGVDLSGAVVVVTGASAGLGVETSRVLAGAGARVVMVARDQVRLDAAMAGIIEAVPAAAVEACIMDLADLGSVREAAAELLQRCPSIDLLINNAGVMACPLGRTADGFELQFGTNHLGHFLFSCLLVPALCAAVPSRVVTLSSNAHKRGGVNFDDPNYRHSDYEKWAAYGASKTANALFALALDTRLADRGVRSFSVHPGAIGTDLGRHLTEQDFVELGQQLQERGISFKSVPQGAATTVWAATTPDLAQRGGLYLEDCAVASPAQPGVLSSGVEAWATDAEAAERLWTLSEELVGQEFSFD